MANITSNESILIYDGHKLLFPGISSDYLNIYNYLSIKKEKKTNSVSNNKLVLNKIYFFKYSESQRFS